MRLFESFAPRAPRVALGASVPGAARPPRAQGPERGAGGPAATGASADAPLRVRGLTVAYGDKPAIFSVDADLPAGSMTAIVGPNGAGKSTFLKGALGVIPTVSGEVTVFGRPFAKSRARVAYVPQRASVDWDFPALAEDVVMMGLYGRIGLFRLPSRRHRETARACLARVGMEAFAERQIGQLSGGQQQRVFLARALAQDADLYLLDEPFAGVDAATERVLVSVLQSLRDEGRTVACVHHDLATVPEYFDRVLLLNGAKIAEGPTAAAFTEANLQAAYGGRLATTGLGLGGPAADLAPDLAAGA
ncbi:metal ABC transporter ATP-binding protein [Albimonas sp. CAU 1670]|uniref:metal ABC transporter ATP-binding protein n=1 Tax=Albimonas sp. CAU 1670 TaxID=3032599 RepID=UPI0023DAF2F0|nr:metal ABC transporter ATP-binding protein [Albimonas sp. CAU 1670]MDF2233072.1 metal ABC transporter ATP-binding protein [Albimonas sp. CAU 1670]